MTTQKSVYETARQMGITRKYAVGMADMHWQIVRMSDYAILYEGQCDEDYVMAELFRIGINKNDVAFI
jgi:hypothetical protein